MKSRIDTVFVLVIFCVFAFCVLLVIMLSASAYTNMNEISRGQNERILLSYIRTKIRNADIAGAVSVGEFHGISTLLLEENIGGRKFVTKIFMYEGAVRELFFENFFARDGNFSEDIPAFEPQDGVAIIRAEELKFSAREGGLIQVCTKIGSTFILPRAV